MMGVADALVTIVFGLTTKQPQEGLFFCLALLAASGLAGVAAFSKAEPDISDFLSRAERKLNKSKREGKNQVSF